ncbi:MAG: hemerythrin domain-containing protein [Spirochaetota bacterium]
MKQNHKCPKPRGCLMMEHRMIERVIGAIRSEKKRLEDGGEFHPAAIDQLVDFMRTYADNCHHGKEEDILFEDMGEKKLSEEDDELLNDLIEEHKVARATTNELVEARNALAEGDRDKLPVVLEKFQILLDLYPQHIEKEDKRFFPNSEEYFSDDELDEMLERFYDFDMEMIHNKYKDVADELEERMAAK